MGKGKRGSDLLAAYLGDKEATRRALRFRQGVVTAISGGTQTLTVKIGGSSTEISGVRYLSDVTPALNKVCWLLTDGLDWLVIGHQFRPAMTSKLSRSSQQTMIQNADYVIWEDPMPGGSPGNDGFDYWGMWASGQAQRLTLPFAGQWRIEGSVRFVSNNTGIRELYLERDGSVEVDYDAGAGNANFGTKLMVMGMGRYASGAYFRLRTLQSSGGGLNINAAQYMTPFISATYLGPYDDA